MRTVGVTELKTRASEILHDVREHQAQYTVTYRGKPIGILSPLAESLANTQSGQEVWDELERLGEEIARGWCSPLTSIEILAEMRR